MDEQTSQLIEAIRSSPVGTFKLYRATEEQPAVEQSMNNRNELVARVWHARNSYCLIEVISLRIQYLDRWLRIYYENVPHQEPREREFGRLLKQCLKLGLEKSLYDRIQKFNKKRVHAIHGYVLGSIAYEELYVVVAESDGLSEALEEFVILNAGEVITTSFENQHHNRGDTVFHVPHLLTNLRSRLTI